MRVCVFYFLFVYLFFALFFTHTHTHTHTVCLAVSAVEGRDVERSLLDALDPRVTNDARDGEEVLLDTLSLHLVPAEAPECRLVSVGKAGQLLAVDHPLVLTCRVRPLLLCDDPLVTLDQVLHPSGVGPLDVVDGVVVVGTRNPGVRPLFLVLFLREGHHRPVVLEVDARSLGRARHRDE